jgi:hypothetical protein
MNKNIILAILALSLTTIFCTIKQAGQQILTPDGNSIVNETLTAMANITEVLIPTIPPVPTLPTVQATGGISGHLSYPSDFIPPLRVVAFNAANTFIYYFLDTAPNQPDYAISGLPVGIYHVVSYRIDASPLAGGYTQMVPCGLAYGCNDHSFIEVKVSAGQTTTGIDPGDWYAEAGTFPPMPTP